ncbi:hypothetical protein DSLASN_13110 [Desulfoluna limicola]|uniref:Transposase n=1 Tax=Desulfoluna limicola TaxID=2810562 RepID=A0ABM7PEL6_9BACT|nr:hypothetical protein DSLASN_13110 [Desulfoluna limicola]
MHLRGRAVFESVYLHTPSVLQKYITPAAYYVNYQVVEMTDFERGYCPSTVTHLTAG